MACPIQATISGKFAPLIGLKDDDIETDTMITTYNTAMADTTSVMVGKERRRKQPWITEDVLDLFDDRRHLKKRWNEAEGANIIQGS